MCLPHRCVSRSLDFSFRFLTFSIAEFIPNAKLPCTSESQPTNVIYVRPRFFSFLDIEIDSSLRFS